MAPSQGGLQPARAGPLSRPFPVTFCDLAQLERASRSTSEWLWRRSFQWAAALVAGTVAGTCGFGLNWLTEALQLLRFKAAILHISAGGGFFLPWLAFVGVSCSYGLVAALGVALIAPIAAGSGIPQMKAWINGVDVPGAVSPRTLLVKAGGVAFAIASGLIAGKEGPYIFSGGILGVLVGKAGAALARRWAMRQLETVGRGVPPRPLPKWVPALAVVEPREASDHASVGTSAGVGTAFQAPIAGICYVAEEGTTIFSVPILWKACLAAACAVGALQIVEAAQEEGPSLWSFPLTIPTPYSFSAVNATWSLYWWYVWELPLLCLLVLATGVLGALWSALCCRLLALRARLFPARKPALRILEVLLVVAITGTVWLGICYASPCSELPPSAVQADLDRTSPDAWLFFSSPTSLFPQLWCGPGQYSSWGQLFFMPIDGAVRGLFTAHPPGGSSAGASAADETLLFDAAALGLFFSMTFFGLLLTYGTAAPTGIFIPTLGCGAAAGRLCGRLMQTVVNACGGTVQISLPAWSAVGAAGLLAGNTRLVLSTLLIVSETSGCTPILVPLILATVIAKFTADSLAQEVYDYQMQEAGYIFVEDGGELPPAKLQRLLRSQANDAMTPCPFATLLEQPPLGDVIELLHETSVSTIPVVRSGADIAAAAAAVAPAGTGSVDGTAAGKGKGKGLAPLDGLQDAPQLVGAVYRWQLLSLLRRPALLELLLLPPPGPPATAAGAAAVAAAHGVAANGSSKADGSCGGAGTAGAQAVQLPTKTSHLLTREQRLMLLCLLEQSPGDLPRQQAAILAPYLQAAAAAADSPATAASAPAAAAALGAEAQPAAATAAAAGAATGPAPAEGAAGAPGGEAAAAVEPPNAGTPPAAEPSPPPLATLLERRMDLEPLLFRNHASVRAEAPVDSVRDMLRHLGMYSVLVQSEPRLLGIVTRQDLGRLAEH